MDEIAAWSRMSNDERRALKEELPARKGVTATQGGISFKGDWSEVWRANLELRGATRILVRIGSFMAFHLAQLDKRATKFPWSNTLPHGTALKVEVTCTKSKIYHDKAAAQRIENALLRREPAQAWP